MHLVDTDGRGVREMSAAGPIVDGTEYPLDLLVFASGFEITTGLVDRLGFDPVGRGGVRLSERWHDGTHSLHGILTADLPNFLVVSSSGRFRTELRARLSSPGPRTGNRHC